MALLRTRKPTVSSMVASAARIQIGDTTSKLLMRKHEAWQKDSLDMYDLVPEVHYAANYVGNSLSKLRLYVGERPEDPAQEPAPTEDKQVAAILDALRGPSGGHGELIRKLALGLMLPGECYLIGLDQEEGENFSIRSIEEITGNPSTGYTLSYEPGANETKKVKLTDDDFIARIWLAHPRYEVLADSPMRAVLSICEELLLIEKAIRAAARSRAAGPGILLVPDELSLGNTDATTDNAGDGEAIKDPFLKELMNALITPIQDEGDASAVVPMLARGPGQYLEQMRHLTLHNPVDDKLFQRLEAGQKRLAQGLDLPLEAVLGISDLNHWSAWAVKEETYQVHLQPKAIAIYEALTAVYLLPALREANVTDPDRYLVWGDPAEIVRRPNQALDTKDAHERMVISDQAYRSRLGFDETEAPSDDELKRRTVLERGALDPVLTEALLRMLLDGPRVERSENGQAELPEGEAEEPEEPSEGPPPSEVTAAATRRDDLGRRLLELDRQLRDRLLIAADAALRRILERAGAQLRSRATKDKTLKGALSGVAQIEVAQSLGPKLVASLGLTSAALVDGGFASLEKNFVAWTRRVQVLALSLVPDLTDDERTGVEAQQERDTAEAWRWLERELSALASDRLFDPSPEPPAQGEFDDSVLVPVGIIREALARAGGSAGQDADARVGAAFDKLFLTALGVATGWLLRRVFKEHKVKTEGYVWDYGAFPRSRPFEPHEALSGVTFKNFDDPVLTNNEGFPASDHFLPGDHSGCVPAGFEVSAPRIYATTERWYEGELIDIATTSGSFLSVTPNHPVLTDQGFVPAGLLNEGGYVVRGPDAERVVTTVPMRDTGPHEYQSPALIEDVARSFGHAGGVIARRMPTTATEFHGDGVGSEVHVVRADGSLMNQRHAALRQQLGEGAFQRRDERPLALAGLRGAAKRFETVGATALGFEGERRNAAALLRRPLPSEQLLGANHAAPLNTELDQALFNRAPIHAVANGEALLGDARLIGSPKLLKGQVDSGVLALDQITKITRRRFVGHVFNLHTETNWFCAGSIIVHNCFCDIHPIMLEEG